AGDVAGGGEPVHPGHLDVEDGEVGVEVANQVHGLVAPARLPHHLVALFFEQLLQVEADYGLVLGDHDARRCLHWLALRGWVRAARTARWPSGREGCPAR